MVGVKPGTSWVPRELELHFLHSTRRPDRSQTRPASQEAGPAMDEKGCPVLPGSPSFPELRPAAGRRDSAFQGLPRQQQAEQSHGAACHEACLARPPSWPAERLQMNPADHWFLGPRFQTQNVAADLSRKRRGHGGHGVTPTACMLLLSPWSWTKGPPAQRRRAPWG